MGSNYELRNGDVLFVARDREGIEHIGTSDGNADEWRQLARTSFVEERVLSVFIGVWSIGFMNSLLQQRVR